jgi:hypothetical protein
VIVTTYPCCGGRCLLPDLLDRQIVERRHFCAGEEVGTLFRVERTVLDVITEGPLAGTRVNKVEFFDYADPAMARRYGARKVPRRTVRSG